MTLFYVIKILFDKNKKSTYAFPSAPIPIPLISWFVIQIGKDKTGYGVHTCRVCVTVYK